MYKSLQLVQNAVRKSPYLGKPQAKLREKNWRVLPYMQYTFQVNKVSQLQNAILTHKEFHTLNLQL